MVGFGPFQEALGLGYLLLDAVLLGLEEVKRDGIGQVCPEELAPLVLELGEPAALAGGLTLALAALLAQVGVQVVSDGLELVGWHLRDGVQLGHLVFHDLDRQVLEVTAVALVAAEAEEVEVLPLGEGEAQPRTAAPAVDRALEVVRVDPFPLAGLEVGGQHLLHLVEELTAHERLVTAGVDHAAEGHVADVVGVVEDAADLAQADRFAAVVLVRAGAKAALGQLIHEDVEAVVAGGVELEGELDERGALGVKDDGPHDTTVRQAFLGVEVANRGATRCAALFGLLAHPLADFGGEVGRVELGHGRQDAVQHAATGRLVDVLGGRDQADTGLANPDVEEDVVLAVAGPAIELVDDEEVGWAVLEQPKHPLELGPVHGAAGFTAFDELGCDLGAEFSRLAPVGLPLSGQGVAVGVVGLVDLAGGRDPEVRPCRLHAATALPGTSRTSDVRQ